MKMNTAIINISDRAESTVGFTVVCVLCVVSGHIDVIVLLVFIFVRPVGFVVCRRVFVLTEKKLYVQLCVRISRHHVNTRRYNDIRISTRANDSLQHQRMRHPKIERNGIQEKNGGIRTKLFRYSLRSSRITLSLRLLKINSMRWNVKRIKGIDTTANVLEQFDYTISWCGMSRLSSTSNTCNRERQAGPRTIVKRAPARTQVCAFQLNAVRWPATMFDDCSTSEETKWKNGSDGLAANQLKRIFYNRKWIYWSWTSRSSQHTVLCHASALTLSLIKSNEREQPQPIEYSNSNRLYCSTQQQRHQQSPQSGTLMRFQQKKNEMAVRVGRVANEKFRKINLHRSLSPSRHLANWFPVRSEMSFVQYMMVFPL